MLNLYRYKEFITKILCDQFCWTLNYTVIYKNAPARLPYGT